MSVCHCGHGNCSCRLIDCTSITVTTNTSFILNADPKIFVNNKEYILRICECLPVIGESGIEPVFIKSNGQNYPVLDVLANPLLAGRLRGNRCYRVFFGDSPAPGHFIACNTRKCLEYNPNPMSPSLPETAGDTIREVLHFGGSSIGVDDI